MPCLGYWLPSETHHCETHSLSPACDSPHGDCALLTSTANNYHLRTPPVPPGATLQLLMTTMGPGSLQSMTSVRSSLWEHQLCATSHPSKHHCRGQSSRAASPSACSPQCCLQGSSSHSCLHQVWCKSKSMLVKSLELSMSSDVDNISLSHHKA